MTGVLLLAHGSREEDTMITMEKITSEVKNQLGLELVECAYLQFCDVNLEKGLEILISKGAKDIKVIPYFLFQGVHIKEDIPAELEEFKKNHADVSITFGDTLGSDKRLAMIVADRVREIL
ncbi:sirohydrochlorin chelatase [Clostridium cylindrosporum]|uniref:Cobalamin (Vitamin B12) biosynthesis protein CbiX n=1 Tax=Clostridium cylindrosporum DSM 605 TaxID=1121307 RepID=A0A0J8DC55_CLOCY|nr:CbiX/SirB N-terminal domain-containing protein [Clostridium cylindrosporum]KMT21843.1 cobalamin (vitamin B12) biosynthesis protein CbiX [Clostridium cylindrosporum DSM 605]